MVNHMLIACYREHRKKIRIDSQCPHHYFFLYTEHSTQKKNR